MSERRSLRLRVALAFAVFGGLVSLMQASGLYIASRDLGKELINDTLTAELDDYIARRLRNPRSVPEQTATIRAYVIPNPDSPPPPAAVAGLPPGRHRIAVDGHLFRAAVRDRAGQRFIVLYNEQELLDHERGFLLILAVGVLVMVLLSAVVGYWLAGRVIAPVTDLARRVTGLRPEQGDVVLAAAFPWNEVHELAQAIDDYQARLRAFIERERLFTGDVSHELRTPLAVINGAAELMRSDPDLDEANRKRLLRISRSAVEMTEITEALLVLAREKRDSGDSAPCDVAEVITDVVEKLRHLHEAKPIEVNLAIDARPQLPVERAVLAMAVGNLLRNAYTHTDRGRIDVHLDADGVTVTDTGPGIDPALQARIMERHYRGPHSTGAGIGLSLVRRICDRYGWRFTLHSQPGSGTQAHLDFRTDS